MSSEDARQPERGEPRRVVHMVKPSLGGIGGRMVVDQYEEANGSRRTVLVEMPFLYEGISILENDNSVAARDPARSRCISISSSNVRGSEAVSSSSSGDFIHSWYVFA